MSMPKAQIKAQGAMLNVQWRVFVSSAHRAFGWALALGVAPCALALRLAH
jgi:hypothetical protein